MRILLGFLAVFAMVACTDRSVSVTVPKALEVGTPETVFAATTRAKESDGTYGFERADRLRFMKMTVSVPPTHTPGNLNFSYGNPNPNKQFVLAGVTEYNSVQEFGRQLRNRKGRPAREVTIFVHGYNATQTETAFRAAQLSHDIGIPGSILIYSWPSRAKAGGYAYDIDSMLFARDGLEQTIRDLKALGVERVVIVAHSMGSALTMEMMRQAELRQPGWSAKNIEGVILISPDLDVDVFRSQMDSIKNPPQPFVVMVSEKDKILNISARIRGTSRSDRLGSIDSVEKVAEFPIDVVNTTAFSSDAGSSHFVAATSPAMLSILNSASRVSNTFGPEAGFDLLVPPHVRHDSGATEIVLTESGSATVASE